MEKIKKGRIINIISNIFYVEVDNEIIECASRGIFKNKEIKPVVGDIVEINIDENIILEVCDRISYIKRPKIANMLVFKYRHQMYQMHSQMHLMHKKIGANLTACT